MCLLYVMLLLSAVGADIDVDGDVIFELKVPSVSRGFRSRNHNLNSLRELVVKARGNMVTVAPVVECMYQYPEQSQIDDLLSNMMNQLTKVFVRAHVLLTDDMRRKHGTRFIVIHEKHTNFFDHIFDNMTKEYLRIYNKTADRVNRSEKKKDPCSNQEEIKTMWGDLLDSSLATFRRAASQCIEEHLKVLRNGNDTRTRARLGQFLLKEVAKIRASHLDLLCENFQLCYNELL